MANELVELKQDFGKVAAEQRDILTDARKSGDPMTDDQEKRYEALDVKRASLKQSIERQNELDEDERALAADKFAEERRAGRMKTQDVPELRKEDRGLLTIGAYAQAIARCHTDRGGDAMALIQRAATTYGQELVGADGGYLVPSEMAKGILAPSLGQMNIYGRTNPISIGTESMVFPVDETPPWSSGEVETLKEGGTMTQKKSALKSFRVELFMYSRLMPVTDQLLMDARAMTGFLTRQARKFFTYKLSRDIIAGDGAGEILGILNSPCLESITRANSDKIDGVDILAMLERTIDPEGPEDYVWLVHPNAWSQLAQMTFSKTTTETTHWPIWMLGGFSGPAPQRLNGWPVIRHHACKDLGDKGDLILADLTNFLTLQHTIGMQTDTSMHIYFEQNMTAFRVRMRVGGRPWLSASIAPENGSTNLSYFVTIAA